VEYSRIPAGIEWFGDRTDCAVAPAFALPAMTLSEAPRYANAAALQEIPKRSQERA
jgi:hypothetical protein